MTDRTIPFGYALLGISTACCTFWSVTLNQIEYIGTWAFMALQVCIACWLMCGLLWLINKVRQAFDFASRDVADFVAGKPSPVIPHKLKDPVTGKFVSRQELLHAALQRDVEAG